MGRMLDDYAPPLRLTGTMHYGDYSHIADDDECDCGRMKTVGADRCHSCAAILVHQQRNAPGYVKREKARGPRGSINQGIGRRTAIMAELVAAGEMTRQALAKAVGLGSEGVSHHLKILEKNGKVARRTGGREGAYLWRPVL